MSLLLSFYIALSGGLTHAFEPDHVLAVTNIVSRRNRIVPAIKDGIFWGLGHTSTIFLIGVLMILFKANIPESSFSWFEAGVGLMLILVASYRLYAFFRDDVVVHKHLHEHAGENKHLHTHVNLKKTGLHKASYGIGVVHGLAGSGALVVLVMTQIQSVVNSLLYLLIFGFGSVIGMSLIAGIFSVPFSKKIAQVKWLRAALVIISSLLCLIYGVYIIFENI